MTRQEAQRILLAYRPDTADGEDPEVAAALAMAKEDPELGRWLEETLATQAAFRRTLREIEPPPGLKERILAEHESMTTARPWWAQGVWAAAAVLSLLVAIGSLLFLPESESRDFAGFRDRMAGTVIREYRMDIETGDAKKIQNFLKQEQLDVELPITPGLSPVPLFGAGHLSWRGNQVAMVCHKTRQGKLLFVFAIDEASVDQPPGETPIAKQVSHLTTLSWSRDGKTFVLAGEMGIDELKNFL